MFSTAGSAARASIAIVAALLLLAACGDDDPGDEQVDGDGEGSEWVDCRNEEAGYVVEHPAGWETNPGDVLPRCSLFDPEPVSVPDATEIPLDIAIRVRVEPTSLEQVVDSADREVLDRQERRVDGRDAVRLEVRSTGEGLEPGGLRSTMWVVDLEDEAAVAATSDVEGVDHERAVEVLDRMMSSARFDPRAPDDGAPDDGAPDDGAPDDGAPDDGAPEDGAPEDGAPEDGGRLTEAVGPGSTGTEQSPGFPALGGDVALLGDVRVGRHDGFDRVVFEFERGDPPGYRIGYVERPVREDFSGNLVELAGSHALEVRFAPAAGFDPTSDDARETYEGPMQIDVGGAAVVELQRIGDFEGQLAWVLGIDGRAGFAVAVFEDPLRVVIDVHHQR